MLPDGRLDAMILVDPQETVPLRLLCVIEFSPQALLSDEVLCTCSLAASKFKFARVVMPVEVPVLIRTCTVKVLPGSTRVLGAVTKIRSFAANTSSGIAKKRKVATATKAGASGFKYFMLFMFYLSVFIVTAMSKKQ